MLKRAKATLGSLTVAAALALSGVGSAAHADTFWQCATFARMFSGIQLFGDAWTWWNQALGKYATGHAPQAGSVLVFKRSGVMHDGHVAVVSRVLTDRIIQVTHANWSIIDGGRGKVEKDVTVVDVSATGDWSQVKVWYDPIRDLGNTVYPTYGFVYSTAQNVAQNTAKTAGYSVAKAAVDQAASATQSPMVGAGQSLASAAAASTDRIAALIQSLADR
jgi:surface antigen